jgi:glycosyltransferase involved in cell wall biosynthesis
MKISIITVAYNSELTIEDTINSVISQTYDNIEYIIIDGGSTDSTLDIINKYSNKINLIISEKDKGVYDAMNKGIMFSNGAIIGFLNSDDIFTDNNIIELIAKQFHHDNNLSILYGNLYYVNRNNILKVIRKWRSQNYFYKYFEYGNVPAHPTLYLRKEAYNLVGFYSLKYKYSSDYDLMLRLFKKFNLKFYYLDHYIVKMRLGGITSGNFKNRLKQNIEIYEIWKDNDLKIPFYFFLLKFLKRFIQFL